MTCLSVQPLLEALLDGELDPNQQARILEHLEVCSSCSSERQKLERLSASIREQAFHYRTPDSLRQKIIGSLHVGEVSKPVWPGAVLGWKWLAAAACVVTVLSLSANFALLQSRQRTEDQLVAEAVFSGHMRSLLGTHLFDIPSSDRHTVKPWFAGHADVSPVVADFEPQGYRLMGGRTDYLDRQRSAVVVYQHGAHVINVFSWADDGRGLPSDVSRNGYHFVFWKSGNLDYCAVSDTARDELLSLVRLLQDLGARDRGE